LRISGAVVECDRRLLAHPPILSQSLFTRIPMLELAIIFFIIAIILGVFGFRGAAGGFASLAKILFVIFLILAVLSLFF
jgi:uncharacterized membrane protein YtjA (UPF0391 family)